MKSETHEKDPHTTAAATCSLQASAALMIPLVALGLYVMLFTHGDLPRRAMISGSLSHAELSRGKLSALHGVRVVRAVSHPASRNRRSGIPPGLTQ